ncbi:MAG: GNAT family N-acetyltransferase [Pseudomonadota bacterium]
MLAADSRETTAARGGLTVALVDMADVSAADSDAWHALRRHHPHGRSPLLSPQFARLVAGVRDDVRAVLARRGHLLVAALAVHVRPSRHARPVGAPFDDFAGPLIAPGEHLSPQKLIESAGLRAYTARASVCLEQNGIDGAAYPYIIRPGLPADLEDRARAYPKRFKNFRRLERKMERHFGPATLEWGRPERRDVDQLLAWKRRQFRRDGLVDLTSARHSRIVLEAAASAAPDDPAAFGGYLVKLSCQGRMVAGHFGVREAGRFHPWISAFDPHFSAFAPGMVLLKRVLSAMNDMALDAYELGDGHEHYKKYFGEPSAPVAQLNIYLSGRFSKTGLPIGSGLGRRQGKGLSGAPARLLRRLDHIAVCEPGLASRTRALAYALAKRSLRARNSTPGSTKLDVE